VLLSGGVAAAVWCWRTRQRLNTTCWQVATWAPDTPCTTAMCPSLGRVGDLVAAQATRAVGRTRYPVWSEQAYVDRRNMATSLRCAWVAGAVVGPQERYALGGTVEEVMASVWRLELLGLPIRTKRDKAKAASLQYMVLRVPRLAEAMAAIGKALERPTGKLDHITDAAGVAVYGSIHESAIRK